LRVNAPISFGILHLGAAVSTFAANYPEVKVELILNDRFIDPVEEAFDITIRIAELSDSSLIARKLAPARLVLAASPSYLAQAGGLGGPKDLIRHRCLVYGQTTPNARWQLARGGKTQVVSVESAYCSNNGDVLRVAALDGLGIASLPTFLVGPDLAAGRLVEVLPEWALPTAGIYALYAPNRFLPAKTRLLIDYLSTYFGSEPEWDVYLRQRLTDALE
jgi:DNA-binding transcriptional LysR family regulator